MRQAVVTMNVFFWILYGETCQHLEGLCNSGSQNVSMTDA